MSPMEHIEIEDIFPDKLPVEKGKELNQTKLQNQQKRNACGVPKKTTHHKATNQKKPLPLSDDGNDSDDGDSDTGSVDSGADWDEISKPPYRAYNSQDGSVLYPAMSRLRQKYFQGESLPDGTKVVAHKLDIEQWAKKYEVFDYPVKEPDPDHPGFMRYKTDEFNEKITETRPAVLGKMDIQFDNWCHTYPFLLVLGHRNFRKSSDLMRYCKREAADTGATILYNGATREEAEKFTGEVRNQYIYNEDFKRDYGYIIDDKKGNKKNSVFWLAQRFGAADRFPGLDVSTPKNHRTGAHIKIIALDDVVGDDIFDHPIMINNINNWWKKTIFPMTKFNTHIIVVGTFKDPNDIYSIIRASKRFKVIIIKAIISWPNQNQQKPAVEPIPHQWYYIDDKDGIICGVGGLEGGEVGNDEFFKENWDLVGRVQYWKNGNRELGYDQNLMSMQEFLIIRKGIGVAAFETEYQLNPISVTKGYLKFENIIDFHPNTPHIPSNLEMSFNTVAVMDLSYGSSNTADFCCIVVMAKVEDPSETFFNYFIRDVFLWRGGGLEKKLSMIKMVKERYPEISQFGVESNWINAESAHKIREEYGDMIIPIMPNRAVRPSENGIEMPRASYNLSEVKAEKLSKARRIIDWLDGIMEARQLWWNIEIGAGTREAEEGESEMEPRHELNSEQSFPFSKKFDLLDTIAMAVCMLNTVCSIQQFAMIHGTVND